MQAHAVPFDIKQFLDAGVAICAVVKLATQPPGVLQQVVLRPDKCVSGLIRLGETRGDEARCWIAAEHIAVVAILGRAVATDETQPDACDWSVTPIQSELRGRLGGEAR